MAKLKDYKIVVGKNATYNERRAAIFLSNKVKIIGGFRMDIVTDDSEPSKYEVVIGRTSREETQCVAFERADHRLKEFEIRYVDERLYITGLGTKPSVTEYDPSARMNNGDNGTMYGVYYFIDRILGHGFQYITDLDCFGGSVDIEIDESCDLVYTTEQLSSEMPKLIDGAAMYSLSNPGPQGFGSCYIIKTKSGKLIVIDGGLNQNTEHVVKSLEYLSDGKKPHVTAWFLTHMHIDHCGVYRTIAGDPEYGKRLSVETFYCDLRELEYYTELCLDKGSYNAAIRETLLQDHEHLGVKVKTPKTGDRIVIDEFTFDIINTPTEIKEDEKLYNVINDSSIVMKMTYDNKQTFMLLADAEGACNDNLLKNHRHELKSDVVQLGHHGVANVSRECYMEIGAKIYISQTNLAGWYCDQGEIGNEHDPGRKRTYSYIKRVGAKHENIYSDIAGVVSWKLPIEVK